MSNETKAGPYTPQGDYNILSPNGDVTIFRGTFERDQIMKRLNAAYALGQASREREALGRVNYKWPDNTVYRDPVSIHILGGLIRINARGIEYGTWPELDDRQGFLSECQRLNLEWVVPLDRSHTGYTGMMDRSHIIEAGDKMCDELKALIDVIGGGHRRRDCNM